MKRQSFTIVFARLALLTAAAIWGWYICAMFRTSDWGYDDLHGSLLRSIAAFGIFVLPFAFIPLLGLSWRNQGLIILALCLVCISTTELFTRWQEHLLIQRWGKHPTADFTEPRWWPFEHHSVGFARGEWWGCD